MGLNAPLPLIASFSIEIKVPFSWIQLDSTSWIQHYNCEVHRARTHAHTRAQTLT